MHKSRSMIQAKLTENLSFLGSPCFSQLLIEEVSLLRYRLEYGGKNTQFRR